MLTAALVLSFALSTNDSLGVHSQGPPFKDEGLRLEIHKVLPHGFYADLIPYVWKSRDETTVGNGGAVLRVGWENEHVGVALRHLSEHNFDRPTPGGNVNVNMFEVKWKLK